MAVKLTDIESVVERELVQKVRDLGGVAEKVQVLGQRGFFDRLVTLPGGRVIFVEVKRPRGGIMSPHQVLRKNMYTALGAEVAVIRKSEDIDRLLSRPPPEINRGSSV